jgi:hypothetical protein
MSRLVVSFVVNRWSVISGFVYHEFDDVWVEEGFSKEKVCVEYGKYLGFDRIHDPYWWAIFGVVLKNGDEVVLGVSALCPRFDSVEMRSSCVLRESGSSEVRLGFFEGRSFSRNEVCGGDLVSIGEFFDGLVKRLLSSERECFS